VRVYDAAGATSRLRLEPLAPLVLQCDTNLLEDRTDAREWHPPFGIRTVRVNAG